MIINIPCSSLHLKKCRVIYSATGIGAFGWDDLRVLAIEKLGNGFNGKAFTLPSGSLRINQCAHHIFQRPHDSDD